MPIGAITTTSISTVEAEEVRFQEEEEEEEAPEEAPFRESSIINTKGETAEEPSMKSEAAKDAATSRKEVERGIGTIEALKTDGMDPGWWGEASTRILFYKNV